MKPKDMIYELIDDNLSDCYLYWYLKKSELENFKQNLVLEKSVDGMCWVCESIERLLDLMEQTVMCEGKSYINKNGHKQKYPLFIEDDYVIIQFDAKSNRRNWYHKFHEHDVNKHEELNSAILSFDLLQIGTKGDLKVKRGFTTMSIKRAYILDKSYNSYFCL